MPRSHWKDILNRNQYDNLPFISGCLLGVLLLSAMRDLFLSEQTLPAWWYGYYGICALVILLTLALRMTERLALGQTQTVSLLCAMTILINPSVNLLLNINVGLLYMGVALMGVALTVLSMKHLIFMQVFAFSLWLFIALWESPVSALLPAIVIDLVAIAMGVVVLQRRIATIERIYKLESRVEALESFLPMCSNCKKTRDEQGNWRNVEAYIEEQDESLKVPHGICPDCKQELYGDVIDEESAI